MVSCVYDKKKMNGKYQVGSGRVVAFTHDTPFINNSISASEQKYNKENVNNPKKTTIYAGYTKTKKKAQSQRGSGSYVPSHLNDSAFFNSSISSLFNLVKNYGKEFRYNSVNPVLLNEDGMPEILYHGTRDTGMIARATDAISKSDTVENTDDKTAKMWYNTNVEDIDALQSTGRGVSINGTEDEFRRIQEEAQTFYVIFEIARAFYVIISKRKVHLRL